MIKSLTMRALNQPEEFMPKDYRSKEVKYILAETRRLNSLGILQYDSISYGLTRLLRYICYNKNVKRTIDYSYVDNDWLFTFQKDKAIKNLEEIINSSSKACCLVVGQIRSHRIEETFDVLSSLRNMYKHKICFLLQIRLGEGERVDSLPKQFKYILANNYLFLNPLNKKDWQWVINDMAKQFDVVLSKTDIQDIRESCKGNLLLAKEVITNRHMKIVWKESEPDAELARISIKEGYLVSGNKVIENEFTKNESLIFKLFIQKGVLVSRDDIANIIAPKVFGDGVTDELIDQSISRLRKKLRKLKITYHIRTVRGRGYLGEYF